MTTGKTTEPVSGNSSAQQSRKLIQSIARKRRPVWMVVAIITFIACVLIGLFLYPQSYTTTTSISLSSSDSGNPLAMLTGSGGGKKKYIGPLKSRYFADQVEKAAQLKDLYHLRDEEEAIEKLQRGVRFDDNAVDGLLYITMSLDAPAKMSPNSEATRKRVQKTTAIVCNAYAKALKNYIKDNDNDKDLVLLRAADVQVKQARAEYNASVDKWINFVKQTKSPSVGMSSSPTAQSPELSALQALFVKRGALEVEIKSADALLEGGSILVGDTPNLREMPTEDPLLAEARRRYAEAKHDLQDLLIQYADTAPTVLRAKERLQLAKDHLEQQAKSIIAGKTSENVKRQALLAEQETVLNQITQVEQTIQISKSSATSFERFHAEVELDLKVLEATATHQAELKITTPNSDSRATVVDVARPPLKSRPGVGMTILISALLAITAVLACFGVEFTLVSSQLAARGGNPAGSDRTDEV